MKLRKHTNGLSLLKRRTWYADPPADDSVDEDAPAAAPPKTGEARKGDLSSAPTEDLLAEIKALRKENADRRKKASELEAWKADQDAKAKLAEDSTLIEQNKFKELLDKREKELATLNAQLASERITNLKMKIGVEMKVPAPLISRLQGDTEEALRDDAKALIESLGLNQQAADPQPQKTPARSQTTTTVPDGQPPQDSPEARRKARQNKTPAIFEGSNVRFVNKSE